MVEELDDRAINYIKLHESITNKSISKETQSKINKIIDIINNEKYEYLSNILRQNERYKILIHFLLMSDRLKIDRKFKTEEGQYYFNMSYEYFEKVYKHSKSTYNRNINLFVVLGLIGKDDPYNKKYYSNKQLDDAYVKGLEYKEEYRNIYGKRLDKDIMYEVENLYFNVSYTAKKLKEADAVAKELIDKKFSISAMSSIYIYRLLGEDATSNIYYGKNYRTETDYSILLSETIKTTILEEVEARGYATEQTIFESVKSKGVLFARKNTDTEKELRAKTRPSLYNTFKREYKRTLGLFLLEHKELRWGVPTKELKEIYKIESNKYVLYNKKDFESKLLNKRSNKND